MDWGEGERGYMPELGYMAELGVETSDGRAAETAPALASPIAPLLGVDTIGGRATRGAGGRVAGVCAAGCAWSSASTGASPSAAPRGPSPLSPLPPSPRAVSSAAGAASASPPPPAATAAEAVRLPAGEGSGVAAPIPELPTLGLAERSEEMRSDLRSDWRLGRLLAPPGVLGTRHVDARRSSLGPLVMAAKHEARRMLRRLTACVCAIAKRSRWPTSLAAGVWLRNLSVRGDSATVSSSTAVTVSACDVPPPAT